MSAENSQASAEDDMEEEAPPRHKRGRPNDSPDPKDQLLSKDVDMCGHCHKKCSPSSEALQCDLCAAWVHASCEGFTKKQYGSLNQLTKSIENVMFYCRLNNCVTRSKQFIFNKFEAVLASEVNQDNLQSLVKEQDEIRSALSQLSSKVNELCSMNQNLGTEIKATAESISRVPVAPNTANVSTVINPSVIVDEYLDHERRKSNLIVYNLEEPAAQSAAERSKKDSEKLIHLFQTEFRMEEIEVTKCIRLGKITQNRVRPVLITIPSVKARSTILKNASSLRKSENFKNVYISPDLTIKEREEAKQLRLELQRRRSQGERNLVIRRGRIITNIHNPSQASNTNNPPPDPTSN